MIIKYTEEEFKKAKSMDLLPLECEHCGEIFLKPKKEITFELKHPERRRCRFCSIKCSDEHHKDSQMHFEKCANCGKEIKVKESDYKRSKTKHFFCSHSCSASFNNKTRKKTKNSLVNNIQREEFSKIVKSSEKWSDIGKKLGYKNQLSTNIKESILKRCKDVDIEIKVKKQSEILNKTKGELFNNRKNWQSARSSIRRNAQKIFLDNNKECKCAICGYNKHVEVAHIKAVSEFDDNATIKEINSIDNLIGLCPNHHWEYDNGLIKL